MSVVILHPIRAYADTSVYGGVFDREFSAASRTFFAQARAGYFKRVVSAAVSDELARAPVAVRKFFNAARSGADEVFVSQKALDLQERYMQAGIVGVKWQTDALHVALATVAQCRLIVSWNFKHIVRFDKIGLYNAVNAMHGYG